MELRWERPRGTGMGTGPGHGEPGTGQIPVPVPLPVPSPVSPPEHDDRVGGRSFPGRRRKGRGPFRGKMYSEVNPRSRPRRGRPDEDDGDVPMAEPHDGPRGR